MRIFFRLQHGRICARKCEARYMRLLAPSSNCSFKGTSLKFFGKEENCNRKLVSGWPLHPHTGFLWNAGIWLIVTGSDSVCFKSCSLNRRSSRMWQFPQGCVCVFLFEVLTCVTGALWELQGGGKGRVDSAFQWKIFGSLFFRTGKIPYKGYLSYFI